MKSVCEIHVTLENLKVVETCMGGIYVPKYILRRYQLFKWIKKKTINLISKVFSSTVNLSLATQIGCSLPKGSDELY